jgi:hypothetical protein
MDETAEQPRQRVSRERVEAAITRAGDLVDTLNSEMDRDPQGAVFVLLMAIRMIHACATAGGRAEIETRTRDTLALLYQEGAELGQLKPGPGRPDLAVHQRGR